LSETGTALQVETAFEELILGDNQVHIAALFGAGHVSRVQGSLFEPE
jgi:hypothetical protein